MCEVRIQKKLYLRKPEWLKVRIPGGQSFNRIRGVLQSERLHSICWEARCPNIMECFQSGTATFLIMGNICTRNCLYCNVGYGRPEKIDENETSRLVEVARRLEIRYLVITSVTRDDLIDGGADQFVACIEKVRKIMPQSRVEVLIPDFRGNLPALDKIIEARPDVINHNIEVVRSLFRTLRPDGHFERSLKLLQHVHNVSDIVTKSGFMIGFGETLTQIDELLRELAEVHCQSVTIGQYQQPTARHWPVKKYYRPDEFDEIKEMAQKVGFADVEAGPLVRSSYHADRNVKVQHV
ncbi:MAG: lipoyl synthase [Deltaproteobacteria bacterium]